MISFKSKADTGASIAILSAVLVLAGTGLFMLFLKPPDTEGVVAGKTRSRNDLEKQVDRLESDKKKLNTQISGQVWTEPLEEIGPTALKSITTFAQSQSLKLMGFRPQKTVEVNGLTQVPFIISVEGTYPNVVKFTRQLEASSLKMGTNLVQVSATDPNSDLVSATIGVVAYRLISTAKPVVAKNNTNATKKEN